eukprot:EG_transcript_26395
MALAAMYQRIPYSILSEVNKKKPQNYAILKLPPNQNDQTAFAAWERASAEATVTFDDARQSGNAFRDSSFGKWETRTFPKDIDFETALERIEHSNSVEPRVLKYKLNFTDGCHILLTRSDWSNPTTLFCTECYNPHGEFEKKTRRKKDQFAATEGQKRQQMLVDEMGHLLYRRRKEDGDPMNHSFQNNPPPVGKVGYDFTPMTYISHEVRPNMNFVGVRPGLKETNKTAFHYLRRTAANPSSAT